MMALAQRAGLSGLVEEHVGSGKRGRVNDQVKVPRLVAGDRRGDSMDDVGPLLHSTMPAVFVGIRAPSMLESFLRAFTQGMCCICRRCTGWSCPVWAPPCCCYSARMRSRSSISSRSRNGVGVFCDRARPVSGGLLAGEGGDQPGEPHAVLRHLGGQARRTGRTPPALPGAMSRSRPRPGCTRR
jgi:hypothetical protein